MSAAHAHWDADASSRTVFAVEGMRCAACARAIERAVGTLEGVERVSVNAATARAAVDWMPRKIALDQVLEAVRDAGFKPVPLAGESAVAAQRQERRSAIKRIGLAGLGMMQTMMLIYGLYATDAHGIDPRIEQYLRLVAMLVATPVLVYSGAPFFQGAWRNLRQRALGMDVPVALALSLAWSASVVNTLRGSGEIYFDSVTMFIFFLLVGRFAEMNVRHRNLSATEALVRSLPATAALVAADGSISRVPVADIAPGDRLSIPRGAVVPVDATLAAEAGLFDESLVTGESVPVTRRAGQALPGGAVNAGKAIQALARSGVNDSTLATIVGLLERAQAERPPVARAADRAASWFVVIVLGLAGLVALSWLFLDPTRAFAATLAVLVVTCPCALSLATPAAVAAATTRLARLGILVTRPDALERLARVDTVVLDKTGTLTRGSPSLQSTQTVAGTSRENALAVAAALERASNHPVATAFDAFADPTVIADSVDERPGCGIEGRVNGERWRIGRRQYVMELAADAAAVRASLPESLQTGASLCLGNTGGIVATFEVSDPLRADAPHVVSQLRALGLEVMIASGDRNEAVRSVAQALELRAAAGRLTPEQKLAVVQQRQREGHRVLMIGDGINDGPVLAAAHVSCAMGQGSAVAQAAADLLLLNDSLGAVAEGVSTARRTLRVVRQNLRWAFLYNVAAVPLAAVGWIAPWAAAIGMSVSSLAVVLNARRLSRSGYRTAVHERVMARPETLHTRGAFS